LETVLKPGHDGKGAESGQDLRGGRLLGDELMDLEADEPELVAQRQRTDGSAERIKQELVGVAIGPMRNHAMAWLRAIQDCGSTTMRLVR
jgi:hypothetical protein